MRKNQEDLLDNCAKKNQKIHLFDLVFLFLHSFFFLWIDVMPVSFFVLFRTNKLMRSLHIPYRETDDHIFVLAFYNDRTIIVPVALACLPKVNVLPITFPGLDDDNHRFDFALNQT